MEKKYKLKSMKYISIRENIITFLDFVFEDQTYSDKLFEVLDHFVVMALKGFSYFLKM